MDKALVKRSSLLALAFGALCCAALFWCATPAHALTRIHVMPYFYGDAIILESDGHFGMVDAGEDTDYPSGEDPRYPLRDGITTDEGYEEQTIAYMREIGVTEDNFEFFIGTHAHSDHIGAADEVVREFKPDRVYVAKYDDSYIESEDALWDNQYIYDHLVEATEEVGAMLVQRFGPASEHKLHPTFALGEMTITIVNEKPPHFFDSPMQDANDMSWGVIVEAYGQKAFLAGDINNYQGDEDRLIKRLGDVDLLKLAHHGNFGSNTEAYLRAIAPEYVIQTGQFEIISAQTLAILNMMGAHIYTSPEASMAGYGAIVATFGRGGITFNITSDEVEYRHHDHGYVMAAYVDGKLAPAPGGWVKWGEYWFWFEPGASVAAHDKWIEYKGDLYYATEDSNIATGWYQIDEDWYLFDDEGRLIRDTWVDGHHVNKQGICDLGA